MSSAINQHIIDKIKNRPRWCPAAEDSVRTNTNILGMNRMGWIDANDLISRLKEHTTEIELMGAYIGETYAEVFTFDNIEYFTVTPDGN